jgi:hypothetical protein
MQHAFISDGRLFLRQDDKLDEIESPFARNNLEDYERHQSFRGWKSSNQENSSAPPLWGTQASQQGYTGFRFLSIAPASGSQVYYLLTNQHVTGLFHYDTTRGDERRLFHKNEFQSAGIDFSPERQELVLATVDQAGVANLSLFDAEGRQLQTVTGGDSRDTQPAFSRAHPEIVYYQTAGIARHDTGGLWAFGPESINRLNLESGEMEEVLADDSYDYLLPRDDREGNLYFIRRPYLQPGALHPWHWLGSALLFPFHFLTALLGFLHAFTRLFGEQPKPVGPGFQIPEKDKYIQVFGQTVNLAKLRKPRKPGDDPSLVPANYELLRLGQDGEMEVLAKNVCSYDVTPEGDIHYTNGFRVRSMLDKEDRVVFRHPIIEALRVSEGSG